jgi:CxxC motif-containing protein (DUF1111 family)
MTHGPESARFAREEQKKMKIKVSLAVLLLMLCVSLVFSSQQPTTATAPTFTEAPAGFDNQPNGLVNQATFDADRSTFDEQEDIDEGLGPVFNARSCGECHATPISGGSSQVTELRAGHYNGHSFVDHPGGSLINDRAIDGLIQERILAGNEVRTLRLSPSILGLGFVEAIDDDTLSDLARSEFFFSGGRISGQVIKVPVVEAGGALRVGRFGWKNQNSSLVSFAADAYLNEMGITSPLQPTENTSNGNSVAIYDTVADPEDNGDDLVAFAQFMRATKSPPRDTALQNTPDALAGALLFNQTGCNICHTGTLRTSPTGAVINGGQFVVPAALGNKIIHPFSDFLLHDIDTGDGIVQNGGPASRNKVRTSPLWGLRVRTRLMHDGSSLTPRDAILRHDGEARFVINNFRNLSDQQKNQLLVFLRSL